MIIPQFTRLIVRSLRVIIYIRAAEMGAANDHLLTVSGDDPYQASAINGMRYNFLNGILLYSTNVSIFEWMETDDFEMEFIGLTSSELWKATSIRNYERTGRLF
ncbi:hypothetical protein TNCV_1176641 [Trichonephila clavipes]|nr:hypothetical protein TNCV_1176641 [Trichonephila clavipes]